MKHIYELTLNPQKDPIHVVIEFVDPETWTDKAATKASRKRFRKYLRKWGLSIKNLVEQDPIYTEGHTTPQGDEHEGPLKLMRFSIPQLDFSHLED